MSEEKKDIEQNLDVVCEPVAAYTTKRSGDGVTYVHDELDDLDWSRLPILGPKTAEEAIARIERAEASLNDPTKWVTSEQMWAEMHQKYPWLR